VTGTTGLSRTFSRATRRNDHRRRSSTIADVNNLAANASVPAFFFEVNPHGNGGLQNAVRSVADAHVRTASEPTASTTPTSSGAAPARPYNPGTRKAVGEYTWVGTIGCSVGDFDDPLRKVVEKRYKDEKRSAVVWVEDETLEPAYDLFCKQVKDISHPSR
jgi:trehalose 6-phosphate synthase/phosphatase